MQHCWRFSFAPLQLSVKTKPVKKFARFSKNKMKRNAKPKRKREMPETNTRAHELGTVLFPRKMINALYKCLGKHLKMLKCVCVYICANHQRWLHSHFDNYTCGTFISTKTMLFTLICHSQLCEYNFARTVTNHISNGISPKRKKNHPRTVHDECNSLTVKCIIHDRFDGHIRFVRFRWNKYIFI